MLRKRTLLMAAIGLILAAPAVHAAGWTIGVNGGISKPTGDLGTDLKLGPVAGIDIGMRVNEKFAVGAEGNWTQNTHKDVGVVEDLGGGDTYTLNEDKLVDMSGGVHGKFMFPMAEGSKIAPYAMAGVGLYHVKEDYKETLVLGGTTFVNTDESDGVKGTTRFGGKGGLGAVYKVNEKTGITLAAEYNVVTVDTAGAPSGTPSTFKFWGVRGGVSFNIMAK